MTNDGLVSFKHVGGNDGVQVVPDLAVSLPTPAGGGTDYRFRLRSGIRYSTGRPVRPGDVRYTFERLFKVRSAATAVLYGTILGAEVCERRPASLRSLPGDRCRRVREHGHLPPSAAGSRFLVQARAVLRPISYRLERRMSTSTHGRLRRPARTGLGDTGEGESSSWYATRSFTNGRTRPSRTVIRTRSCGSSASTPMLRSPPSSKARPPGCSTLVPFRRSAVTSSGPVREPAAREPGACDGQRDSQCARPAFRRFRVRRALNYAIDRRAIVKLYGGPRAARPACQILPPQIPGFRRYCPYTLPPDPRLACGAGARSRHCAAARLRLRHEGDEDRRARNRPAKDFLRRGASRCRHA